MGNTCCGKKTFKQAVIGKSVDFKIYSLLPTQPGRLRGIMFDGEEEMNCDIFLSGIYFPKWRNLADESLFFQINVILNHLLLNNTIHIEKVFEYCDEKAAFYVCAPYINQLLLEYRVARKHSDPWGDADMVALQTIINFSGLADRVVGIYHR